MKKILVISSSLRHDSNSDALAEAFAKGAAEAGNEVESITLKGKNLHFCTGCLACQKTQKCVIADDAPAIVDKMYAADVIAFATPIYYYGMSGQLKTLLDRANPLFTTDYHFRDIYFLSSAAEEDPQTPERAVTGLGGWIECFENARLAGSVFAGGVNAPGDIKGHAKVTDHHALVTTGVTPEGLSEAENAVYTLIAGRMLEAFSPPCGKETLLMECRIGDMAFRSKSSTVTSPGWRGVFGRKEDKEEDEEGLNDGEAVFAVGDRVPVSGHGLVQKKTMPKPLYTEATLLAAMETCGKDIADGQAREAVKDLGIGTPATRAAIITTLFKRDYVERNGKSLVPTEKGLLLYGAVKDMLVADVSLTGSWENALAQIERHTLDPETFMASIRDYTRKATGEILKLSLPAAPVRTFICPKCKTGHVILRDRTAKCDNEGCGLLVFRKFLNKELAERHLEQLLTSGSTELLKGLKGRKGVAFDAVLTFDAEFNLTLSFPKSGDGKNRRRRRS